MPRYNSSFPLMTAIGFILLSPSLTFAEEGDAVTPPAPVPAETPATPAPKPTEPKKANSSYEIRDTPATKLWVSDKLEAPMRSCADEKCRVVKVVRPGMEMTQVGVTSNGWSKIKVGEQEGYLLKRYLQDHPGASQQLEGAQRQSLEAIQGQQSLKSELDNLKKRAETAEAESANLRKENYEIKQNLDYVKGISGQTLAVNEDNRRLKAELESLRQRAAILEQEAEDVEGKNQRAWVMVGAGVVLVGWILGRFARTPRRRGWGQL